MSLFAGPGCSCSNLQGEVDDLEFTRCAQTDPPAERELKTAVLELSVRERLVEIKPNGELKIAAFTGPVGGPLARTDLAQLGADAPGLVFYVGGLGETADIAAANLASLAALRVPVLFVAGGADRLRVIESAFDELEADAARYLLHGSGLRELRVGRHRFAIVPGAPLGRYAIDDEACGFVSGDLDDIEEALGGDDVNDARVWLLGWAAPSGWGVTQGFGRVDAGNGELAAWAQTLHARGGLFAFPEVQAGHFAQGKAAGPAALVVPRLGRTGSALASGGHVRSSIARLVLRDDGLQLR